MHAPMPKPKIPWKTLTPEQRKRFRANPQLYGFAEYEAMESVRTSLPHYRAVERCARLSLVGRKMLFPGAPMADHHEIIRQLQAKKIPFVLIGMHGISSWIGRVRATHDIDVLVKGGRNFARALKAVGALYPGLIVRDFPGVTGFFAPNERESLVDVIFPHRTDLQETLNNATWVEDAGLRYRIPTLENALANKYGAIISPQREFTKHAQDVIDFTQMVTHSTDPGREPIDLERLGELGEIVSPNVGRVEILQMVADAKAGKMPNPNR